MFQTKYDAIDGRSRDNKKRLYNKKFSFAFSSQNSKTTTHRKTATFFTLFFFFFKFLQQSCVNAGPDGFFRTGLCQPGPTHVSVHCGFFFFLGGGKDITRAGLYRSYDDYYAQEKL